MEPFFCVFVFILIFLLILFLVFVWKMLGTLDIAPKLYYKDSDLTKHLLQTCISLKTPFRPKVWMSHSYIQTLIGYFKSPTKETTFTREYIQMIDKGIVALDWLDNSKFKVRKSSPIIVIFPRLTGDALSVSHICLMAAQKGFRTVVLNSRGHGSSYLSTPKLTSPGDPTDARQALCYISQKYPKVNIIGVGIGAGCALMFSYLGEYGSSSLLKAAVCVSPSYDNNDSLSDNIPKFYELLLLCSLKKMIMNHAKSLEKVINIRDTLKTWSLKEFELQVYCKMYGLDTFQTFWEENDPMRDVDDIAVPVLCINSLDDPVIVKDNISLDLFQFYPNLLLVTLEKGGHCGFVENLSGVSWADRLVTEYIENVLEFILRGKSWILKNGQIS